MKNIYFKKWLFFSPFGLILTGFGLCLFGNAVKIWIAGEPYFLIGTLSLICFNSGIVFIAEGVKNRILFEFYKNKA